MAAQLFAVVPAVLAVASMVAMTVLKEDASDGVSPTAEAEYGIVMLQVSSGSAARAGELYKTSHHRAADGKNSHAHKRIQVVEHLDEESGRGRSLAHEVSHMAHAHALHHEEVHRHGHARSLAHGVSRAAHRKGQHHEEAVSYVAHGKGQHHATADAEANLPQITLGTCVTTEYGLVMLVLAIIVASLAVGLYFQKKETAKLVSRTRGLRAKLRVERAKLLADEKQLKKDVKMLEEAQQRAIDAIVARQNVLFDLDAREIMIKGEIRFQPVAKDGTQVYAPIARFERESEARSREVLRDVVEILNNLPWASVLIEGHTKSLSLDSIDDFDEEVAESRALLVEFTLIEFGANPLQLEAIGLPGALGVNEAGVRLKLVN